MRLREFYAQLLFEATKYDGMFTELLKLFSTAQPYITREITWAREALKREDRIVWYLRWYRLFALRPLAAQIPNPPTIPPEAVERLRAKYAAATKHPEYTFGQSTSNFDIKQKLAHILSLPVPQIQNFQFGFETPAELFAQLGPMEEAWKQQQADKAQHVDPQEGDQALIDFGDGWAWWLLNRGACSAEAKAMGHCGNVPSEHSGDRILSLRKQGPHGWRPSLTFILNGDGYLGEMKGRGNDKPAPQYHPYIVKLLENPIIKGIRGGGYLPSHNFKLSDLPIEEQERLAELKPTLATLGLLYRKFGLTPEVIKKIQEESREIGQELKWNDERKAFIVDEYKSIDDLVKVHGNDLFKDMQKRDYPFDGHDFTGRVGSREVRDLYDELPPDMLQKICIYAHNQYAGEYEPDDHDFTDPDDVFDVLEEQEDDIISQLKWAIADGYQSGSEVEMYKDKVKALRNGFSENHWPVLVDIQYSTYQGKDGEGFEWDSPCWIVVDPKKAAEVLGGEEEELKEEIENYGWTLEQEIELEEPHYGWSGYDEEYAKERAIENMSEIVG